MTVRIQLVLQIDQGNLDGMRELASTDAVYIGGRAVISVVGITAQAVLVAAMQSCDFWGYRECQVKRWG